MEYSPDGNLKLDKGDRLICIAECPPAESKVGEVVTVIRIVPRKNFRYRGSQYKLSSTEARLVSASWVRECFVAERELTDKELFTFKLSGRLP